MGHPKPRFVAIVGSKNSGKTTLAAFLVRRLSRNGLRVASIKHVHHKGFTMDTPNKDSWRLTKAGARTVVVISPYEIAQTTKLPRGSVRQRFALAVQTALGIRPDYVVIEGFASVLQGFSHACRTIVMAKNKDDLAESLARVGTVVSAISGGIADRSTELNRKGIPILHFPRDSERLFAIVFKYA